MANSIVAMSMFHTYTSVREYLHGIATAMGGRSEPSHPFLVCEAAAGAAAGLVQATLNTPLYNVKLRQGLQEGVATSSSARYPPRHGIVAGLRDLLRHGGIQSMYGNYPWVLAQEGCTLVAYFTSYEWFKIHATRAVRQSIDPSGKRDLCAWALAASAAGGVLAVVSTPFENLLDWHVGRRCDGAPKSVLAHFLRDARPGCRRRIILAGLRQKMLLAPVTGLPLLAYEAMLHSSIAPVLALE